MKLLSCALVCLTLLSGCARFDKHHSPIDDDRILRIIDAELERRAALVELDEARRHIEVENDIH